MYIPNTGTNGPLLPSMLDTASFSYEGSKVGTPPGGWSSLIGIVTAIVGNILISFALNTQRYAHMRLGQDREQQQEKQKAQQRKIAPPRAYGTQQSEVAERRAKKNANAEGVYTLEERPEESEEDPLIPQIDSRKASTSSSSTVRPSEKQDGEQKEKSYLKSPIWWVGISLMTVGEAGNFLAYGFAPASIVSPLGVVALISNCLIAPLLLHEQFRWRDGLGVVIAVAGCVTIVLSASDSNPKLDPDSIWHLITRWEFETYLGVTIVLIVLLVVASNKFGDRTILIDLGLVALFGGYTALSTKGVSSLLSTSIWRVVTFPITYLLLAVLITTAVLQIKYINRALQRFNATMVIPVQFVLFTISVIVGSAVLYRDFERQTGEDAAKFIGGCALTFLGVWCITSGRNDDSDADEEDTEQDDAVNLVDEEGTQPEIRERESDGRKPSIITSTSRNEPSLNRTRTNGSQRPSVLVTPEMHPSESQESLPHDFDEPSPFNNKPWDQSLGQANVSAIHAKSTSNLPETAGDPLKPPPMHATTSAPVVPKLNLSSSYRPRTPLNRGISGPPTPQASRESPRAPASPQHRQHGESQYLDPNASNRPSSRLLNRHSIAGLLPGPLTSPLSSSLSAIVADSLRRGVDASGSSRRRSYRRAPSTFNRQASSAYKRHSVVSGELDFDDDEAANLRAGVGSPSTRNRSLSATIGDIFRSGKRQRPGSTDDVNEEHPER